MSKIHQNLPSVPDQRSATASEKASPSLFLASEKMLSSASLGERTFKKLGASPITTLVLACFGKEVVSQTVTPSLTGPFLVGHTSFVAKGPKHPIGVDVYGPTEKTEGQKPYEYHLYPGHPLGKTEKHFCTQSLTGLRPLEGKKFPTVIVSHGFGCEPGDYRPLCEEIASHGFVVLALAHPFSAAYCSFTHSVEVDELPTHKVAEKQAKDISFIVQAGRSEKGAAFKALRQIADFEKCYLMGHGLGGSACLIASSKVPVKGCVNIDGEVFEETSAPLLTILSGQKEGDMPAPHENLKVFPKASHDDFLLQPFIEQALGKKSASRTVQEASSIILKFLK